MHKRKAVCISARVHPGETNSSLIFEGFVEDLLCGSNVSGSFLFKLVPMLNPDGVVCGNY